MSLVDISGIHLEATTGNPVVLLREHEAPHRYLPIFVGPLEATAIALVVEGQEPPRPLTHDLMATVVVELGAAVRGVEISAIENETLLARIDLHGPSGDQSVDSRPSDAIALALRFGAPIYVDDAVLDAVGTLPEEEAAATLSEAEIDEQVESFRAALAELDPADFEDVEAAASAEDGEAGTGEVAGEIDAEIDAEGDEEA